MATPTCALCGDLLDQRAGEREVCLLCRHRTLPAERGTRRGWLSGLIDSA